MQLDSQTREELEALSKEVFGTTSRYQTLMTKGESLPVTFTVTELVPGVDGAEDTTREVEVNETVPGSKVLRLKHVYHTVESVRKRMLDIKSKQDQYRALVAQMEANKKAEQDKAKRLQDVQGQLGGSAI